MMMSAITNSLSNMLQRTPTKRTSKPKKKKKNNNNKPIKVVYISNPMKVKTSASEFRALVQELTGQYAESPPDPSRYAAGGVHNTVADSDDDDCVEKIDHGTVHDDSTHTLVNMPPQVDHPNYGQKLLPDGVSSMENFEPFDDVFTPRMIESISAFLPDSVFFECARVDDHDLLMRCNFIHDQ